MRKGHLAILPAGDGRRAERRIVNFAASLREPGAQLIDAEIVDLSVTGFGAETDIEVEPGTRIWLKLPGMEPTSSQCVWAEGKRAGFEFSQPLHPAALETLVTATRKPAVKRHFGDPNAAHRGRTIS